MTVKFVKRFQSGGAANFSGSVGGSSGWTGVLQKAAQQKGGTSDVDIEQLIKQYGEDSEEVKIAKAQQAADNAKLQLKSGAIDFGMDLLDKGTDLLAAKAWEKQAREKVAEEKAVEEEVSKSENIRSRAAAIAQQYDSKSGLGAQALTSAAGLAGVGVYQAPTDDYSQLAASIGTGLGNVFARGIVSADANNKLRSLTNPKQNVNEPATQTLQPEPGVQPGGIQETLDNRTAGETVALSANQNSANWSGTIGIQDPKKTTATGKKGLKLIRRRS